MDHCEIRESLVEEREELLKSIDHFETWAQENPITWNRGGLDKVQNRLATVEDHLCTLDEPTDNESFRGSI